MFWWENKAKAGAAALGALLLVLMVVGAQRDGERLHAENPTWLVTSANG